MYEELGAFGTASTIVLADFNSGHPPLHADHGRVRHGRRPSRRIAYLYREFQMTVAQMVRSSAATIAIIKFFFTKMTEALHFNVTIFDANA